MADDRLTLLYETCRRYAGLAAAFLLSGANFALAFYLQQASGATAFGLFALVQVIVQFGVSLSNGLFCSPIVLAVAAAGDRRAEVVASFTRAALIVAAVGAVFLFATTAALTIDWSVAVLAAVYGFGSWTRWFFRSVELADGQLLRPAAADAAYGVVVLIATGLLLLGGIADLRAVFAVQVLGCVAAFGGLAHSALAALRAAPTAALEPFLSAFRHHGGWAVFGVVTTETTANAHPYLIAAALGPAAFAPIAAITLLYRPLTIVAQALTQYERPRMARAIAAGDGVAVRNDVRRFTGLSNLAWVANSALVLALVFLFPGAVASDGYAPPDLQTAALLLALIYIVRSFRNAESTALQAAGRFRGLAWASAISAPITLAPVAGVVMLAPHLATWSLTGVLAGEAVCCILIRRAYQTLMSPVPVGPLRSAECAS